MTYSNYSNQNTCSINGHIYHPPPKKKIKMPQLVPHGLGGEFHNLTLEHFEHINSA